MENSFVIKCIQQTDMIKWLLHGAFKLFSMGYVLRSLATVIEITIIPSVLQCQISNIRFQIPFDTVMNRV